MAAKKPGSTSKLVAAAEAAEHELHQIVTAATEAGGWQPVQAEECRRLAAEAVAARAELAKAGKADYEPGANLARWLT